MEFVNIDLRKNDTALSKVMEFDHVIEVLHTSHNSGAVIAHGHVSDYFELIEGELSSSSGLAWELMNGYSGQDRYSSGPIMHESEYIGGGMARDILAEPGFYVALVAYDSPGSDDVIVGEEGYEHNEDADDGPQIGGWAIARIVCNCGHERLTDCESSGDCDGHEDDCNLRIATLALRGISADKSPYVAMRSK